MSKDAPIEQVIHEAHADRVEVVVCTGPLCLHEVGHVTSIAKREFTLQRGEGKSVVPWPTVVDAWLRTDGSNRPCPHCDPASTQEEGDEIGDLLRTDMEKLAADRARAGGGEENGGWSEQWMLAASDEPVPGSGRIEAGPAIYGEQTIEVVPKLEAEQRLSALPAAVPSEPSVLEELADEFERRAVEQEARTGEWIGTKTAACAYRADASLCREKAAALKGGEAE